MGVGRNDAPQRLVAVMPVPSKVLKRYTRSWGVSMGDMLQGIFTIGKAAFVANEAWAGARSFSSHAFHGAHKLSGKALDTSLIEALDVFA